MGRLPGELPCLAVQLYQNTPLEPGRSRYRMSSQIIPGDNDSPGNIA